MKLKLTYEMAHAAGQDEGNRSMRKAGRDTWNEEDWHAAATKMNELLDMKERWRNDETYTRREGNDDVLPHKYI